MSRETLDVAALSLGLLAIFVGVWAGSFVVVAAGFVLATLAALDRIIR